jgi:SAM-dependent methyltransferase
VAGVQHLGDVLFDRWFGIETATPVGHEALGFGPESGIPYQAANWLNVILLVRMLRGIRVTSDDVFIDIGCGKGQAVFVAAHFPFDRVVGVDLSADLISIARRNLDPSRHRFACPRIDLVAADAAAFTFPSDVNTCFLYNPFPRPIMERVVANIETSLSAHPRRMRVFYLNAVDGDLLVAHGYRQVRRIRQLRQYVRDP